MSGLRQAGVPERVLVVDWREAIRILFKSIALGNRAKQMWLCPWPEFAGLFVHRRDLCGLGTLGRGRTVAAHTNDDRWFATGDLIAVAS